LSSENKQLKTPSIDRPQKEPAKKIILNKQELEQPHSSLKKDRVAKIAGTEPSWQQKQHIEKFSIKYNQNHQKSKQLAQRYRPILADIRAAAGFRHSIKEILYPIAGERALGSRLWDVDGNEYIDITMGFGVLLFGHAPEFIKKALEKHEQQGLKIGPQSKIAGEVAQLICELTEMERVTFCNTGTEAIMTALRLARLTTGRKKIAIFSGSYHGHFDGVLATGQNHFTASPLDSGISDKFVEDVLVLEYGQPESIEILLAQREELAAVLVEPVQSRRPHLQPKDFLQKLRELTTATGSVLIFDEVLTGFRVHPGGTQAWSGVKADIATFGKIIGGGTPIGVVAGKARYMNGIDGGVWNYGDDSYPEAEKTFFAGTFNKNHSGMVAAKAVLEYLKQQGSQLQEKLNQRTEELATRLNNFLAEEEVPIRVEYFSSFFRFVFTGNLDLLFYHLIDKGIYIWEGRTCFLSTAHTEEDIEKIIQAVKESVKELKDGDFFPNIIGKETLKADRKYLVPLSEAQKQLRMLAQMCGDSSVA
ncbi:MAG: aspartate aminotransferase family protein, partial [Phormidium sp.]